MSAKPAAHRVSAQDLVDYAHELNGRGFTKLFGWRWVVRSRETPDGPQHYLDRYDLRTEANRITASQPSFAGVRSTIQTKEGELL